MKIRLQRYRDQKNGVCGKVFEKKYVDPCKVVKRWVTKETLIPEFKAKNNNYKKEAINIFN